MPGLQKRLSGILIRSCGGYSNEFLCRAEAKERGARRNRLRPDRLGARTSRRVRVRELRRTRLGSEDLRHTPAARPSARPVLCLGLRDDARRHQAGGGSRSIAVDHGLDRPQAQLRHHCGAGHRPRVLVVVATACRRTGDTEHAGGRYRRSRGRRQRAETPVHRRAAVRQHVFRPGAGMVLRRADRRDPERPRPDTRPARGGPHLVVQVQALRRRRANHRGRARRGIGCV